MIVLCWIAQNRRSRSPISEAQRRKFFVSQQVYVTCDPPGLGIGKSWWRLRSP